MFTIFSSIFQNHNSIVSCEWNEIKFLKDGKWINDKNKTLIELGFAENNDGNILYDWEE